MSVNTGADTPAEAPEAGTEPEDGSQGTQEAEGSQERERDDSGRLLSREAAGYRKQLRETRAERDSLREQLDKLQRTEVERLATQAGLAVAGDVWLHGASLENLRTDTGEIDSETVSGLVGDLLRDRPGLQAARNGDFGIGQGASAAGRRNAAKVGLSQLLKPGRG